MTSTSTMVILVSVMLAFNVGLSLFQGAVSEVNPDGVKFFDVSASPYANYVQNDTLVVDDSYLPADDEVETDISGNIFTDTYDKIKSWTQKTLAPFNFIANVLRQPYGFLLDIGLAQSIALAIGVFWYMIALIIVVSWWMGR